jgi:hypothetical protein
MDWGKSGRVLDLSCNRREFTLEHEIFLNLLIDFVRDGEDLGLGCSMSDEAH